MSAYDELRSEDGPCVLLESTSASGPLARLSILARRPRAILVADRSGATISSAAGTRRVDADPVAALRALLREVRPGTWPDEGGVAGALAYDFARPGRPSAPTPLLVAMAVDRFRVEEAGGAETLRPSPAGRDGIDLSAFSNMSRDDHRRRVLRLKEHIAAGDIYQANLSQRFDLPFEGKGLRLYHHLRCVSPAPFSGYLRAGALEIVSASPERLLMVDGDRAWTRPIAGTRPRAADPRRR